MCLPKWLRRDSQWTIVFRLPEGEGELRSRVRPCVKPIRIGRIFDALFYASLPQLLAALGLSLAFMVLLMVVGRVPVSYNVRNLLVRWTTTVTTGLAFTLVVSLMTMMLAFVNGMTRLTEKSGQPGNVIVLADGATPARAASFADLESTRKLVGGQGSTWG